MRKGELLTVFGALWLAACSPDEPGHGVVMLRVTPTG